MRKTAPDDEPNPPNGSAEASTSLTSRHAMVRELLDALPEAITETDLEGKIRFASQRTARVHGYQRPEDMIGLDAFALVAPEDRARAGENLTKTLAGDVVTAVQYTLLRRDGSTFPGELSAALLRDADGAPLTFVGITRDISERVRAERDLEESRARAQESEQRYRTISEASMDGIVLVDATGTILTCNHRYAAMLGFEGTELVGRDAFDRLRSDERGDAKNTFARVLREGQSVRVRRTFSRRDDTSFPAELSVSPLTDETGTPFGAVAVIRDISERLQAEERIEDYQAHLRSLSAKLAIAEDQERRRIGSGLHDSVAQMLIFCGLRLAGLDTDVLRPEVAEAVSDVRRELTAAVDQLRSLLFELSSPVLHELGLPAALRSEVRRFQRNWPASFSFSDNGMDITLAEDIRLLLFLSARELLTNAVKHSKATTVNVRLTTTEDRVEISVEDDGQGFSPESEHSGYGLSHIRERMTHIGGRFEIASCPKRGTRTLLSVPREA